MEKSSRKRGGSLLLGILIVALLFFLVVHIMGLQDRIQEARAQEAELTAEKETQEQQNAALEAGLEKADDEEYKQELAREQLGMVSPGEKVFHDVSN